MVFGFAVQKTYSMGVVSCKVKADTKVFGIKISSKITSGEMNEYLESLVGYIEEERYEISSVRSLFGGWVVGTPQGNWLWLHTLKTYEEKGLAHETAVEIAEKLISDDDTIRQSAIDQILQLQDSI